MAKLWRIWLGATKLELSDELTYRLNFFLKTVGLVFEGFTMPLLSLLIYTVSTGIPGWDFPQFLLLNGTFMLIAGLSATFFHSMTWRTIQRIWHGSYDIDLIRPVRPLALVTMNTFNPDGLPYVCVGAIILVTALMKMHWAFNIAGVLGYLFLIGMAFVFFYAFDVMIIALSFLFLKTWALSNAVENILDLGKYPLTIYGFAGLTVFTFLFPVGLAAYYPAQALLGQLSLLMMGKLALSAFAFLGFSLLVWSAWMKKYTSAGG